MSRPRSIRPAIRGRRDFLKAGGAILVGFSLTGAGLSGAFAAQQVSEAAPRGLVPGPPDPRQLDTWLAVHEDNTATVYIGYVELGQGSTTSLLQVAAEELDLDMSQVSTVRLDTDLTPNQGGTYSSSSIARGSPAIRMAAAEARYALLGLASKKLGVPAEKLSVARGVVSVEGAAGKKVTYGELIGNRRFNLAISGKAPLKPEASLARPWPIRSWSWSQRAPRLALSTLALEAVSRKLTRVMMSLGTSSCDSVAQPGQLGQ